MLVRIGNSSCSPLIGLVCSLALMLAIPAVGQTPPPVSPAQFDPSDVYFQGYLAVRASEQLESAGDFIGALEKLGKASQLFDAVQKYYPKKYCITL